MPLKTTAGTHGEAIKGRGAPSNIEGRFEVWSRDPEDDGWFQPGEDEPQRLKTVVHIERAKSIISRHDSPDVGFEQSVNPYRGCAHGCSYCGAPDTPILMGNGRTLALSELRVGDEVYGTRFDGRYRRYVKSRVLAHWSVIKPAYRTTLEDGTTLVTSGDHRFLTDRGWKHVVDNPARPQRAHLTANNELLGTGAFAEGPCETDDYRRGYLCGMIRGDALLRQYSYPRSSGSVEVISQFRLALRDPEALLRAQDYLLDFGIATREFQFQAAVGNRRAMHAIGAASLSRCRAIEALTAWPNEACATWAQGYLAGIFDAEGSFSQTIRRIPNTDAEIIAWTSRCLRRFGFDFALEHSPYTDRKPIDVVRLKGGLREHLRFFHTVRPAITRKLDLEGQAIKSDAKLRVVSVEPLGKAMRLFDITTQTEDFIANGVVSHNCFARPTHAYLGLSPGLDFETRLTAKVNAAEKLREEIAKPGYKVAPIAMAVNTDAYQPLERTQRITRSILEVAHETHHPVTLITKSALIERDLDLLAPMAQRRLVHVTLVHHHAGQRDLAVDGAAGERSGSPAACGEAPVGSRHPRERERGAGHPFPHGCGAGAHPGSGGGQRRLECRLRAAAAALGGAPDLQGVAREAFPAQGRARDGTHPRHARRPRERPRIRLPHGGQGHHGRAPRPALPQGPACASASTVPATSSTAPSSCPRPPAARAASSNKGVRLVFRPSPAFPGARTIGTTGYAPTSGDRFKN